MPVVLGMASAITSRRVATYGAVSTLAAIAVVLNSFRQRSNFYSAAVMLGGSNGCMMVLFNFGVFLTLCLGKIAQKIFFGPLRAVEIEHLHERLWYAITESLLAMTIFRDDFDGSFALLFGTMLFLKVFHWLARDRVEYMEQSPSVTRLFHARMIGLLSILFEFDLFFATFAVEVLLIDQNRKGIMIMFASEFFILTATLWATIAKYLINCQDMRSEEPWEAKSMYVFFVDLATDFLKLITYLGCFGLILSYYGLPLNIIRDVYMTARSFFGRLSDFIKFRAATRNMDTRFPDATQADLTTMSDGTCIICREEMIARAMAQDPASAQQPPPPASGLNETPKKLPCGHIFHFHCLRSWLERQQSCPTCRRTVFTTSEAAAQAARGTMAAAAMRGGQPNAAQAGPAAAGGQRPPASQAAGRTAPQVAAGAEGVRSPTAAARDRMQSLVAQLQSRDRNGAAQPPRSPAARQTSQASPPPASSSARAETRMDVGHRQLVERLFGSFPGDSEREESTKTQPNGQGASGLDAAGSTTNATNDKVLKHLPTPPWKLRSVHDRFNSTETLSKQPEKAANGAVETGKDSESATQPATTDITEKAGESSAQNSSADPTDAREAARLAALKRLGLGDKGTSTPAAKNEAPNAAPAEKATPSIKGAETRLPNDPRLIPLFDPDALPGFGSVILSGLPFPLADRHAAPKSFAQSPALPLDLSPDDVTRLSNETRDGLEARLQLLYRVEGSVHGLVEELTRALSAMPAPSTARPSSAAAEQPKAPSDEKGKAPAEGLHASVS